MRIDPSSALRTFRAIAAHGSFTRAAHELEVSASALSQAMRQLEERLGVRLLQRTTRHVGLTEAGREFLARIAPALSEIDTAIEQMQKLSDHPAGTLRITVPPVAIAALIEPNLPDFLRAYPDIRVDVRMDSALTDLVTDGLDAGIRLSEKIQQDMVALPLGGPQRSLVVASPAYLKVRGTPARPRDLQKHNCIRFRFSTNGPTYRWEFAHPTGPQRGRWFEIDIDGNLICNDSNLQIQTVLDGIGVAHVMQHQAIEHIASGRLISVLDRWFPPYDGFYLYYPSRFQVPPKLRVFAEFFRQRLQQRTTMENQRSATRLVPARTTGALRRNVR
jgi:DNA-binding transcriptional LysR family regulator